MAAEDIMLILIAADWLAGSHTRIELILSPPGGITGRWHPVRLSDPVPAAATQAWPGQPAGILQSNGTVPAQCLKTSQDCETALSTKVNKYEQISNQ